MRTLQGELLLADLVAVEKRIERLREEAGKKGGSPQERETRTREVELFERLRVHLEAEQPLRALGLSETEVKSLRGFGLLTLMPTMVIYNQGENEPAPHHADDDQTTLYTDLSGKLEMEIAQMPLDDAQAFLCEYNIGEPGLNRIIRLSYDLLGVQSFLTTGEDEVRAWTIRKGETAVEAASVIHSDIARGFIRAEVIAFDDLVAAGSMAEARKRGTLRLEGKHYVLQDGDIMHVKFNE